LGCICGWVVSSVGWFSLFQRRTGRKGRVGYMDPSLEVLKTRRTGLDLVLANWLNLDRETS